MTCQIIEVGNVKNYHNTKNLLLLSINTKYLMNKYVLIAVIVLMGFFFKVAANLLPWFLDLWKVIFHQKFKAIWSMQFRYCLTVKKINVFTLIVLIERRNYWYVGIVIVYRIAKYNHLACHMTHQNLPWVDSVRGVYFGLLHRPVRDFGDARTHHPKIM